MKLLNRKSVEDIAEQFKIQYTKPNTIDYWNKHRFYGSMMCGKDVYKQILECSDTREIIERKLLPETWIKYRCDICRQNSYAIIDTGYSDGYGDSVLICAGCAVIASNVVK